MLKTKKRLIGFITLLSALCMCIASLLCVNTVKANGLPTSASNLTMSSGAWIKESSNADENGFRYVASISADEYTAFSGYGTGNVEYGVMLCKTSDIVNTADADLRFDSSVLTKYDGTGNQNVYQYKTVKPIVDVDDFNGNGDTTEFIFICSFIGIKDANFAVDFTARGYLGYRADAGDAFTYLYTNTVDKSVFEVSYKHELDDKTETSTYATSVITSVVTAYPNFEVDATVESVTATTVEIGDKVALSAKLYNAGETESIEVTPKYTLDSLATENTDGTYTVKSLNGFSGKATFPTLQDKVISVAGAENQEYEVTTADLDGIIRLDEGTTAGDTHSHTLYGITDCTNDKPTFTTYSSGGPDDAEYTLHYNATIANHPTDNIKVNQIATNTCKGDFVFDTRAYNAGDYITFDMWYPAATKSSAIFSADKATHSYFNMQNTDGNTCESKYIITAFTNLGVKAKPGGTNNPNGMWYTFEIQVLTDNFELCMWTQTNYSNDRYTYYLKNIRISDHRVVEIFEQPSGVALSIANRGAGDTMKYLKGTADESKGDYVVILPTSGNLNIKPTGNVAVGDKLMFKFHYVKQQLSNSFYNEVSGTGNQTFKSTDKNDYNTSITLNRANVNRYKVTWYDESNAVVNFNNSATYSSQWFTCEIEYLYAGNAYIDVQFGLGYRQGENYNTMYLKDFAIVKAPNA